MSLLTGGVTLTRCLTRGGPLAGEAMRFQAEAKAFRLLAGTDDLAAGWVDPFDRVASQPANLVKGLEPYLLLCMRVDRRRLSGAQLKVAARAEEEKALAMREGRPLNRAEREEMKERARLRMLAGMPAESSFAEVLWTSGTGLPEVWIVTAGAWRQDMARDLFRAAFAAEVAPWTGPTLTLEFLTWLWFVSEEEGELQLAGDRTVNVMLSDYLALVPPPGQDGTQITVRGRESSLSEARQALGRGKLVGAMRVGLDIDGSEYWLTLEAGTLLQEFRSLRLPPTGPDEEGGGLAGLALERVYLIEQVISAVRELYKAFEDLPKAHKGMPQTMRNWIKES